MEHAAFVDPPPDDRRCGATAQIMSGSSRIGDSLLGRRRQCSCWKAQETGWESVHRDENAFHFGLIAWHDGMAARSRAFFAADLRA